MPDYEPPLEHWSSPADCHADCPACADESLYQEWQEEVWQAHTRLGFEEWQQHRLEASAAQTPENRPENFPPDSARSASELLEAKFFQRLREFEAEFPMVYVECWTPDDYEVASGNETSVDWNAPHHVETAGALNRRFDATIGTNWDRLAESAAQPT